MSHFIKKRSYFSLLNVVNIQTKSKIQYILIVDEGELALALNVFHAYLLTTNPEQILAEGAFFLRFSTKTRDFFPPPQLST